MALSAFEKVQYLWQTYVAPYFQPGVDGSTAEAVENIIGEGKEGSGSMHEAGDKPLMSVERERVLLKLRNPVSPFRFNLNLNNPPPTVRGTKMTDDLGGLELRIEPHKDKGQIKVALAFTKGITVPPEEFRGGSPIRSRLLLQEPHIRKKMLAPYAGWHFVLKNPKGEVFAEGNLNHQGKETIRYLKNGEHVPQDPCYCTLEFSEAKDQPSESEMVSRMVSQILGTNN